MKKNGVQKKTARRAGQGLCLVLVFLTLSCASTPTPAEAAKPEFPQWARDLRRGEIVFFGSFPFAFFLGHTVMDTYRASQHNWDRRYAPWPVKSAGAVNMTRDEYLITISAALGGSLLVSVADFIIVKVKRDRAAREAERLAPGEPIIIRSPWPVPGETPEPEDGASADEAADAESPLDGEAPPDDTADAPAAETS
jgi:hypothetical protein